MYSAYKLNKQGDNIQSWCTPFSIWNQSVVPCPVLTVASWPVYRFLKRQVRWSGIPISFRIFQFIMIHTVKGFGIVNKAEIDVLLELSCFFHDPMDVGQGQTDWKPPHRKLTNLLTWTTALSNSMKLWAMLCRATQGGQVMVESPDKMWSTGEGNGKPLQHFCLKNPMNSMNSISRVRKDLFVSLAQSTEECTTQKKCGMN